MIFIVKYLTKQAGKFIFKYCENINLLKGDMRYA